MERASIELSSKCLKEAKKLWESSLYEIGGDSEQLRDTDILDIIHDAVMTGYLMAKKEV